VRLPWRAALLHRQFSHHDISGKYAPGLSRPLLATVRILFEASSATIVTALRQRLSHKVIHSSGQSHGLIYSGTRYVDAAGLEGRKLLTRCIGLGRTASGNQHICHVDALGCH
jgi:hypothetical protein